MSHSVQLVLLCEDRQQVTFARRFLKKMDWEIPSMRVEMAPGGRGAGEQFVRLRFPKELKAHRTRPVSQTLVAILDGDDKGVGARLTQLNQACREAGVPERSADERVAIFVPTWNIETWLAYLDGNRVDETNPSYPRLTGRESECQRHVDELARMCRSGKLRDPAPPSLVAACDEYNLRLAAP